MKSDKKPYDPRQIPEHLQCKPGQNQPDQPENSDACPQPDPDPCPDPKPDPCPEPEPDPCPEPEPDSCSEPEPKPCPEPEPDSCSEPEPKPCPEPEPDPCPEPEPYPCPPPEPDPCAAPCPDPDPEPDHCAPHRPEETPDNPCEEDEEGEEDDCQKLEDKVTAFEEKLKKLKQKLEECRDDPDSEGVVSDFEALRNSYTNEKYKELLNKKCGECCWYGQNPPQDIPPDVACCVQEKWEEATKQLNRLVAEVAHFQAEKVKADCMAAWRKLHLYRAEKNYEKVKNYEKEFEDRLKRSQALKDELKKLESDPNSNAGLKKLLYLQLGYELKWCSKKCEDPMKPETLRKRLKAYGDKMVAARRNERRARVHAEDIAKKLEDKTKERDEAREKWLENLRPQAGWCAAANEQQA